MPEAIVTISDKNALAIFARTKEGKNISTDLVVDMAIECMEDDSITSINLASNAARLLLERADFSSEKGKEDVYMAMSLWDSCLVRYGKDKNFHHRAALYYWLSKACEAVEQMGLAVDAIKDSIRLWKIQIEKDPKNNAFKEKLKGAYKRLDELIKSVN